MQEGLTHASQFPCRASPEACGDQIPDWHQELGLPPVPWCYTRSIQSQRDSQKKHTPKWACQMPRPGLGLSKASCLRRDGGGTQALLCELERGGYLSVVVLHQEVTSGAGSSCWLRLSSWSGAVRTSSIGLDSDWKISIEFETTKAPAPLQ